MRIRLWFWPILIAWIFIGLPIIVIGVGFAGTEIFTARGIIGFLTPPVSSLYFFLEWLWGTFVIFMPFIFFPFALVRKHNKKVPEGQD